MRLSPVSSVVSRLAGRALLLVSLLLGGLTPLVANDPAPARPETEPSPQQRRYYFEHRLLPKWTHTTNGAFFTDLRGGSARRLVDAATEIVSPAYAAALTIKPLADENRVLISLAAPTDIAACFHVMIIRDGQTYRYLTLELTEDLLDNGTKSILGGWTADGGHLNFGARKYTDPESFVREAADHEPGRPVATTQPAAPKS